MTKKIVTIVLCLCLVFSTVTAVSAYSDDDVCGSNHQNTSGGSSGYVNIKTDIYNYAERVYSGVYRYTYGAKAYITTGTSLLTNFTLSGEFHTDASTYPFEKPGSSVNSVTYSETYGFPYYSTFETTTVTYSSGYGYSSYECNGTFQ